MPFGKKQWIRKHYCGFEATNSMLHKCKKRTQPHCPQCAQIETHRHITKCQSDSATRKFRDIRANFARWLQGTTSPGMQSAILAHLQAYRKDEEVIEGENWSDDLRVASKLQEAIGPNAFAEGCLEESWETIQGVYLRSMQSKKSPGRWTAELIKKRWSISWDMWDHRNGWVHRETETRKAQIGAQLDADIETYHQLGQQNQFLPNIERRFFNRPIAQIKKKTEYGRRIWIHTAKMFLERDRILVASNPEIQNIREFLQPGSTDVTDRNRRQIVNRYQTGFLRPDGTRRTYTS